jgi:hypothetical protein
MKSKQSSKKNLSGVRLRPPSPIHLSARFTCHCDVVGFMRFGGRVATHKNLLVHLKKSKNKV